jgi:hypothetical protein
VLEEPLDVVDPDVVEVVEPELVEVLFELVAGLADEPLEAAAADGVDAVW